MSACQSLTSSEDGRNIYSVNKSESLERIFMTFEVADVPHCVVRLINDVLTAL